MALPPQRNPFFRGREAELDKLWQRLSRERRVNLSGPPGVGTTQLAIEYLRRQHATYPDGCFWLRGDAASTFRRDLAALAALPQLLLEERHLRVQARVIEAVIVWLRSHEDWLLVVDDLGESSLSAWADLAAHDLKGHLLVTSREPVWRPPLLVEPIPIGVATAFLLDRTGQADADGATAVATALGSVPLGLELAAAYVVAAGLDLSAYAELLRVRLTAAIDEGTRLSDPSSAAVTCAVSCERVQREDPAAAAILRLCSFLAPDDIPISRLLEAGGDLPSETGAGLGGEAGLERAVRLLERYSLVERQGDGLRVHRLVQATVRESMSPEDRRRWLGGALRMLRAAFPNEIEDAEKWPVTACLVPHVQLALDQLGDQILEPEAASWLLDRVSRYLEVRAEFGLAAPFSARALAVREKVQGPEHPDTATSLNNLGRLLRSLGDLTAARPLLERALAVRRKVQGPQDLDTATSLNDLGRLLRAQGELVAGRPLLEQAVAIRERVLGPDHLDTASSLNNLALLLKGQGELDAAKPHLERALAIRERALGRNHPRAIRSRRRLEELTAQLERSSD